MFLFIAISILSTSPIRANADTGWVKDDSASTGEEQKIHIVIDKKSRKLSVFQHGALFKEYPVAVGANRGNKKTVGDKRTPEGTFPVSRIHDASKWRYNAKDGKGGILGVYGPLFIRLNTHPWQGIGIHGTGNPKSIGRNVTAGCIRMHNRDVIELAQMVNTGTPVTINP